MSIRKTILLRKAIFNFATPSQLIRYDNLCLVNKGSATNFGLRLVVNYFNKINASTITKQENQKISTRKLKIIGYGKSWFENY